MRDSHIPLATMIGLGMSTDSKLKILATELSAMYGSLLDVCIYNPTSVEHNLHQS